MRPLRRPKKRHAFTLLEIMIALSLAAIFFSAIMTCYYQASKQKQWVQKLKQRTLPLELVRQKMTHLFAKTRGYGLSIFYTGTHGDAKGPCLFFSYFEEVDPDPALCGERMNMLYLSQENELCLATWGPYSGGRKEVLLPQIQNLSFSFFNAESKEWQLDWDKKEKFPPFFEMICQSIDNSISSRSCAFFFPQIESKITYINTNYEK